MGLSRNEMASSLCALTGGAGAKTFVIFGRRLLAGEHQQQAAAAPAKPPFAGVAAWPLFTKWDIFLSVLYRVCAPGNAYNGNSQRENGRAYRFARAYFGRPCKQAIHQ